MKEYEMKYNFDIDYDSINKLQHDYDRPSGFLQWKGTDVCMDCYCICGEQFHIDSDFTYYVKCPYCGSVYSCNPNIEFIKILNPELLNL